LWVAAFALLIGSRRWGCCPLVTAPVASALRALLPCPAAVCPLPVCATAPICVTSLAWPPVPLWGGAAAAWSPDQELNLESELELALERELVSVGACVGLELPRPRCSSGGFLALVDPLEHVGACAGVTLCFCVLLSPLLLCSCTHCMATHVAALSTGVAHPPSYAVHCALSHTPLTFVVSPDPPPRPLPCPALPGVLVAGFSACFAHPRSSCLFGGPGGAGGAGPGERWHMGVACFQVVPVGLLPLVGACRTPA
jgi:hypothetical protein